MKQTMAAKKKWCAVVWSAGGVVCVWCVVAKAGEGRGKKQEKTKKTNPPKKHTHHTTHFFHNRNLRYHTLHLTPHITTNINGFFSALRKFI
jgi:hypothetical protein